MTKTLLIGYGDLAKRLRPRLSGEVVAIRRHPREGDAARAVDASDASAMASLLAEDFDQIVVTLTPPSRSDAGYLAGYVAPIKVLVQVLARLGLRPKVLFVSSSSVYGQSCGEWVDETSAAEPAGYAGRRLLEAEGLLRDSGLPHIVARLTGIYGPGRDHLLGQLVAGELPRRPMMAWSNRIHADDAAAALAHLLSLPSPDTLYLVSDSQPVPLAEVVTGLCTALKRPAPLAFEGGLLTGKRVSNKRLLASGFTLQYPDWRAGYAASLAALSS